MGGPQHQLMQSREQQDGPLLAGGRGEQQTCDFAVPRGALADTPVQRKLGIRGGERLEPPHDPLEALVWLRLWGVHRGSQALRAPEMLLLLTHPG